MTPGAGKKMGGVSMQLRKHIWYKIMLTMMLMVLLIPGIPTQAASKKNALRAYKKLLSMNTIMIVPKNIQLYPDGRYKGTKREKAQFSLAYLDSDNIPELFIYDNYIGYALFRYAGGKVVRANYAIAYAKPGGYYPGTGIYRVDSDTEGYIFHDEYIRYHSGKHNIVLEHRHIHDYDEDENEVISDDYYTVYSESISKGRFDDLLAEYTNGKTMTRLVLRKNTASNLKKYLK